MNPDIKPAPAPIVYLDVNHSGSWRRVASFPQGWYDDGDLETLSEHLFELSVDPNLKARIIQPGATAPLVTWTRENGWREWKRP